MLNLVNKAIKENYTVQDFISFFGEDFALLKKLKDTPQDKDWHSEGDVEIHTNMVLKETYNICNDKNNHLNENEKTILVLSALFHDICKPIVTKEKERDGINRIVSPKHEIFARNYLIFELIKYKHLLDNKTIIEIINLVGYHNLPKLSVIFNYSKPKFKQMARMFNIRLMYFLELADMRGRECVDKNEGIELIELFKIQAEDYNLFYQEQYLDESLAVSNKDLSEIQKDFLYYSFIKDYEDEAVFMIEETEAKLYEPIQNFSHVIILSGVAGTGKTTYSKQFIENGYELISLDDLRNDKSIDDKHILSICKQQLKKHLAKKNNVIIDATNYRKDFRKVYAQIGFDYNAFVEIHTLIDTFDNIVKKNKQRRDEVKVEVIENQIKKFELPEINEAHKNTIHII